MQQKIGQYIQFEQDQRTLYDWFKYWFNYGEFIPSRSSAIQNVISIPISIYICNFVLFWFHVVGLMTNDDNKKLTSGLYDG